MRIRSFKLFFFQVLLLCSCQSATDDANNEGSEIESDVIENEILSPEDSIASSDRNLDLYRDEKLKFEEENALTLPDEIKLSDLYEQVGPCDFKGILSKSDRYFLTDFYMGTDVENSFFVSWDNDGELIEAILYGTNAYGDGFNFEFLADNFIAIFSYHQQGFEIDEFGDESFDFLSKNGDYILIDENGKFIAIDQKNEASYISEMDPFILNHYREEVKTQSVTADLFPFNKIPAKPDASTSDVYESLEGGQLYSSCIELRNENNYLIGLIGYKYDEMLDTIPQTYAMILSELQKPIIDYGIVSIEGELFVETLVYEKTKNDRVFASKHYYPYPYYSENNNFQVPVYSETGYLDELLNKPIEISEVN